MYNKSCEELPGPGQAQGLRSIVGLGHGVGFWEGEWYFVETLKSASLLVIYRQLFVFHTLMTLIVVFQLELGPGSLRAS